MDEMDESFLSTISQVIITSTPKRGKGKNPYLQQVASPFKKPGKGTGKGPTVAKCDRCGKEYRSLRYYKSHVRAHVLQECFARYPKGPELEAKALDIHESVMKEMGTLPCYGKQGEEFAHVVLAVVDKRDSSELAKFVAKVTSSFLSVIQKKAFILPSTLRSAFTGRVETILSDLQLRTELFELLQEVVVSNEQVIQCFVCDYVLRFGVHLFMLIVSSITNPRNPNQIQHPQVLDMEDRQSAHYVGGSIVRGFIDMGKKFPKNENWRLMSCALKRRLLESQHSAPASENDRRWTESRNRGGLKFVNSSCLEFLIAVAEAVALRGINSRCIDYDAVLEEVYRSNIVGMWDKMLAGDLPESLSFSLLHGIVRSFCQTYGVGLREKRRNALRDKPEASVPLRHKLAPQ